MRMSFQPVCIRVMHLFGVVACVSLLLDTVHMLSVLWMSA